MLADIPSRVWSFFKKSSSHLSIYLFSSFLLCFCSNTDVRVHRALCDCPSWNGLRMAASCSKILIKTTLFMSSVFLQRIMSDTQVPYVQTGTLALWVLGYLGCIYTIYDVQCRRLYTHSILYRVFDRYVCVVSRRRRRSSYSLLSRSSARLSVTLCS